jgi:deoxyadenosine/deoxycytidine kinase
MPSAEHATPYVVITGNAGTGKSTVVQTLGACLPDAATFPEQREPTIELYYDDPNRCAINQATYMVQYLEHARAASKMPNKIVIQERSVSDCNQVYTTVWVDRGRLLPPEADLMQRIENLSCELRQPTHYVLLDADPNVIIERFRERQGPGIRTPIDRDQLAVLRGRYLDWLGKLDDVGTLVLRTDQLDQDAVVAQIAALIGQILPARVSHNQLESGAQRVVAIRPDRQ